MVRNGFTRLLLGKDLRRLRNNSFVLRAVKDQQSFDELFRLIFQHERPLVMRAADAIEKITLKHHEYLEPHKDQLLSVLRSADHKELKLHISQLIPRIRLNKEELEDVWHVLKYWALSPNESKIVRVNSLQGLFDLCADYSGLKEDFETIIERISREQIPSIQARVRKLKKLG
jgi:hypothetical protein